MTKPKLSHSAHHKKAEFSGKGNNAGKREGSRKREDQI